MYYVSNQLFQYFFVQQKDLRIMMQGNLFSVKTPCKVKRYFLFYISFTNNIDNVDINQQFPISSCVMDVQECLTNTARNR